MQNNILFSRNERKFSNTNVKVLIQAPTNGALLYYLSGWNDVFKFWGFESYICYTDEQQAYYLNVYKPNVIITTNAQYFFDVFSHQRISDYLKSTKCIVLAIAGSKEFPIPGAFSIKNCVHGDADITAMFGFNPFIFREIEAIKSLDWFFVGTNSQLKIDRTVDWLYRIIFYRMESGVLAGVGWDMPNVGELSVDTSVYFYNIAKINLNYHLNNQVNSENEINERTHVISACAGFQLCDSPAIIRNYYDDSEICICETPEEYSDKYLYYLHNENERDEMRKLAYKKAWGNYSMFDSMLELGNFIVKEVGGI